MLLIIRDLYLNHFFFEQTSNYLRCCKLVYYVRFILFVGLTVISNQFGQSPALLILIFVYVRSIPTNHDYSIQISLKYLKCKFLSLTLESKWVGYLTQPFGIIFKSFN